MKFCSIESCASKVRARGWCGKHYERWRTHGNPTHTEWDKTSKDRFWEKVDKSGDCWVWMGATHSSGYGAMYSVEEARMVPAHVWSYRTFVGELVDSLVIDHICHNRLCVNPEHLRQVTISENAQNRSGLDANNTSGFRGVSYSKKLDKWYSRVYHQGECHYGGLFDSAEEAGESARLLRNKLFTCNDLDRNMVD